MPDKTICLLGATGRTGQGILKILLTEPHQHYNLRVYVRSRSKLASIFPDIDSYTRVSIFEGAVTDVSLFKECLAGAETIICALGENENIPGLHLLQDAAKGIVSGLTALKKVEPNKLRPRLLLLSSSTLHPKFIAAHSTFMHWVIKTAFGYPYADLRGATSIFSQNLDLLDLCLIHPPAIVEDETSGHILSTDNVSMAVSYGDLAAGFVDVATLAEYRDVAAIGVSSASKDQDKYASELFGRVVRGMLVGYMPGYSTIERIVWSFFQWK